MDLIIYDRLHFPVYCGVVISCLLCITSKNTIRVCKWLVLKKNSLYYSLTKSWVNTFWINLVTDMTYMFLCTPFCCNVIFSLQITDKYNRNEQYTIRFTDKTNFPVYADWLNVWSRHCSVWQSYSFLSRSWNADSCFLGLSSSRLELCE